MRLTFPCPDSTLWSPPVETIDLPAFPVVVSPVEIPPFHQCLTFLAAGRSLTPCLFAERPVPSETDVVEIHRHRTWCRNDLLQASLFNRVSTFFIRVPTMPLFGDQPLGGTSLLPVSFLISVACLHPFFPQFNSER